MAAFIAILLLEGLPTYYGVEQGVLWQGILAAIFVDIALAICSHLWHNEICLYENQLVIVNTSVEKEKYRRLIKNAKTKTFFFYFLILMSAGFKFFLFFDAYQTWDAIASGTLVAYFLGAILHIFYTGYFFFTSRFNFKMQNEYDDYIQSNGSTFGINSSLEQPINTDNLNIQLIEAKAGGHQIIKKEDGSYNFKTFGVLLDKELAALTGIQQSQVSQSIIAREGLKHQLHILNTSLNFSSKK